MRRYIAQAEACGLALDDGVDSLTDARVSEIVVALETRPERTPGESWQRCEQQRAYIESQLGQGVRLTTIRRRLARKGAKIPYSTLHRYASEELGFCRVTPTVAIVDGKPGVELEVDTGWMTKLEPGDRGRVRRFRAFIFTPNVSRYRFVYPIQRETTETAIEAFEAAWDFYGGVFEVAVVDNTKAIVNVADPLEPKLIEAFLEYAQARGFVVDTARVRKPKDKPRVERSVRYVRDDCFIGEHIETIDFPADKRAYAMRDVAFLQRQADQHGESIGIYAARLLDSPLPWTRMRQVYALLGLIRRFGPEAVEEACGTALAVDLISVKRLRRLIELAAPQRPPEPPAKVIPLSRYLRPAEQYALPGLDPSSTRDEQDNE